MCCIKVLTQLTNVKIARSDIMTQVRTSHSCVSLILKIRCEWFSIQYVLWGDSDSVVCAAAAATYSYY